MFYKRKRKKKAVRSEFGSIAELREYVRTRLRKRMEEGVPSGLPAAEREKYRVQIRQLRKALRACVYGEGGEKDYIKRYIMSELTEIGLTVKETERLLPVHAPERLPPARKFDILLYRSMKQYGKDGFLKFCDRWGLPGEIRREDGVYFEITPEDIERIYEKEQPWLSGQEVLELICDAVYEGFGHGVIDRLRDCRLDGVSGGVSGMPEQFFRYEEELHGGFDGQHSFDSVFVMVRGNTVRLSFLSFESERELRRVTKSLLRYEAPGELSYYRPYMVNDMKDGSRVFACRPPFSESWAFFVRKFDSTEEKKPEELVVGEGAENLIQALKYFVGSGFHIAITGAQGSGKTTLLKALVRYINPKYNLRIEESVFELWMRKEFPQRNILTFRETESVDSVEGLDAFRKTDGNCLMMGEIGNIKAAALIIELSQVSEQQLFTHHAMTTEKLLDYFRNALLRTGAYSDAYMAQEQVAQAFHIHVLCERNLSGERYIKEVSEIVPEDGGKVRMLYRYQNGKYYRINIPTGRLLARMLEHAGEEKERMRIFFDGGAGE
ncbi:MAG: Flp pilus assembly complex ATPase component TadA [Lachnospiraceae bacterium]|nr:Flp pilus assembly complex ATPase component TadA [Lachnospiraceae bacterium]